MDFTIQEKINNYIASHSELKYTSEQVVLSAMMINGVISRTEYEQACQNSAFGTGFSNSGLMGLTIEHAGHSEKPQDIEETDEHIIEFENGKIKSKKAKDGSSETTYTYLKNDDGIEFTITQTKLADGTEITTTALNVDPETGEIKNTDFLNRTTTKPDGTITVVTNDFALNGALREVIITPDSTTTNIYNSTDIEKYDKKDETPINRLAQSIEINGNQYNIQYDGDGNTYVVLQNGDSINKLIKDFKITKKQLDTLNKGNFNYNNMQVGGIIRIPNEISADDKSVKNRKSSQEAQTAFFNWSVKHEQADIFACSFSEHTIQKKHTSVESLAREILPNGSKEQIRTLALRLQMVNKDLVKKLKAGEKITVPLEGDKTSINTAKAAGFAPTPENNAFYKVLNGLSEQDRKKAIAVIQECKNAKITDLTEIKKKVFAKTGISLFDSGKTIKSGNTTKPLEFAIKEHLGLDINGFLGHIIYQRLSAIPQENLKEIDLKKVAAVIGNKKQLSLDQVIMAFETTGMSIMTEEEIKKNSVNFMDYEIVMPDLTKLRAQNFAAKIIEAQYDQGIAILHQYKGNSGALAKIYEGFATGVDRFFNSKRAHSGTVYIEHLEQEKAQIMQKLESSKLSGNNSNNYQIAFYQATGIEFNEKNIMDFIDIVNKKIDPNSPQYQKAFKKAFGSRLVDNSTKFVENKAFWAGCGNLTLSIYAMINPLARNATSTIAAGAGKMGLGTLSSSAVANAAIMGGSTALIEGIDLAVKDAPVSSADISNYIQSIGVSTGFGAFAGYMSPVFEKICSSVSASAAAKFPKLFKLPNAKKLDAVTKTLGNNQTVNGTELMAAYLTTPGSNIAGKSAEFLAEIIAFTGYSIPAGMIAKFTALAFDKDGTLKAQYSDEESLWGLIKQEFGHQIQGLASCKGLTKILMAFCSKKNTQIAMKQQELKSFESLKNVEFTPTEINGQKVLIAKTPNGNFKINSVREAVKLCEIFMTTETAVKMSADTVNTDINTQQKTNTETREVTEADKTQLRELLKKAGIKDFNIEWLLAKENNIPAQIELLKDSKISNMKPSSELLRVVTPDNLSICKQLYANKEFSKLNQDSRNYAIKTILGAAKKENCEFVQQLLNDGAIKPMEVREWCQVLYNINESNIDFVKDLYQNNKRFFLFEVYRTNNVNQKFPKLLIYITKNNIEAAKEISKSENLTIEKLLNIVMMTSGKIPTFSAKTKTELQSEISKLTEKEKQILIKHGLNVEVLKETLAGNNPTIEISKNQQQQFVKQIIANNNPQAAKVLSEFDFSQFGKNGLPLKYSRNDFINNVNEILKGLTEVERNQILSHFGLNRNFDGLLNNKKFEDKTASVKTKEAANRVLEEIEKYTIHNEVNIPDIEAKRVLDGLIQGLPEFTSIIGKQQHDTHGYSVDIHMLKVLQDVVKDPLYKTLSDESKTVVKIASIIHDIGKQSNIIDTGHQRTSAEYIKVILSKFNLSESVKQRIIDTVDNHHWFEEYNSGKINAQQAAAKCRRPEDFNVYKLLAKADLRNVNPTFHLERTETKSNADFDKYIDEKMGDIQTALNRLYETAPVVVPSRIMNAGSKFPTEKVIINGKEVELNVLNINEIAQGTSLEQYGFAPGTTKDNLILNVHMTEDIENTYNLLTTTNRLSENHPILSSSLIKASKIDSRMLGKAGFIFDSDITGIMDASAVNSATGFRKNLNGTFSGLFSDGGSGTTNGGRTGLRDYFIKSLYKKTGIKLSIEEYGTLVKEHLANKQYLTQITKDITIGDKTIKAEDLKTAIEESQSELFKYVNNGNQNENNEITTIDPRIKALYVKVDKLENVSPDVLEFAAKHKLAVVLISPTEAPNSNAKVTKASQTLSPAKVSSNTKKSDMTVNPGILQDPVRLEAVKPQIEVKPEINAKPRTSDVAVSSEQVSSNKNKLRDITTMQVEIPQINTTLLTNINNEKFPKIGSASRITIKNSYKFYAKNHNGEFINEQEHYIIKDRDTGKTMRECFLDSNNPQNNVEKFYSYSKDGKSSTTLIINAEGKITSIEHILHDKINSSMIKIEYNSSEKIKVTIDDKVEELSLQDFIKRFGLELSSYNLIKHSNLEIKMDVSPNTSFNFNKYLNSNNVVNYKDFKTQWLYDSTTNTITVLDYETKKEIIKILDAQTYMNVLLELENLLPKDRINLYMVEALPLEKLIFIRNSISLGKNNPEAVRLSTEWKKDKNTCQAETTTAHPNQNRRALHKLLRDNPVITEPITVTRCDNFDWLNTQNFVENGSVTTIGEKVKNLIDSHATQQEIDALVESLNTPLHSINFMACNLNTKIQSWVNTDNTKIIYNIHIPKNSKCLYIDDLVNQDNMGYKPYLYQSELVIDKDQLYAIMGMKLSPDNKMIIDIELITQ